MPLGVKPNFVPAGHDFLLLLGDRPREMIQCSECTLCGFGFDCSLVRGVLANFSIWINYLKGYVNVLGTGERVFYSGDVEMV